MSVTSEKQIQRAPLLEYLEGLAFRGDRAALADLRRSLAKPAVALPHVARFFRSESSRSEEDALILVAGLFALHPSPGVQTLPQSLGKIGATSDSVELRFRALLGAQREDLGVFLRHAVSLCAAHEEPINYDDLLSAVRGWSRLGEPVQRRWARDFWSTVDRESENE